jgi:hypothetical protein
MRKDTLVKYGEVREIHEQWTWAYTYKVSKGTHIVNMNLKQYLLLHDDIWQ